MRTIVKRSSGLKTCPWCGGEAVLVKLWGSAHWWARCNNAACLLRPHTEVLPNEAEAVAAWNRRVSDGNE